MADRMCSCWGQTYTDEERHDYEVCYKACQDRVNYARHNLNNAWDNLNMAESRRSAQRDGRIK
ncbi:hypothetical protein LCGC14_1761270 [marine sediment metagenome]|uniref:Uncharacterized protein n=1 Tax=marine sediment metagenome TaxID=412755 RepID=A0A0F9HNB1_9ZZZZ